MSHSALADALLPVVLAAGRVQMQHFRAGARVITKADRTPVTVADQLSEALLVARLRELAPAINVIAEEAVAAGDLPEPGARFFLVDPLDGTREFIADRPEFTINIALVEGGQPTFGIIYAPALGVLFATLGAAHAVEAKVEPRSHARQFSDLKAGAIHSRAAPATGLVAVASRSHSTPGTDAFLGQYTVSARTAAGSSLKFCLVAKGEADIYPRVGPTSEWDIAAGHAILTAAGGTVTTLDGKPLVYGKRAEKFRNPDYVAWGRTPLPAQF